MKATLATRKPVDRITAEDLQAFPIWEYALDEEVEPGRDETWVRPVQAQTVPAGAYSQLVAASFASQERSDLQGFMVVTTVAPGVRFSSGAILSDQKYILSDQGYHGIPTKKRSAFEREMFTGSLDVTFPLSYRLRVLVAGEERFREGIVE